MMMMMMRSLAAYVTHLVEASPRLASASRVSNSYYRIRPIFSCEKSRLFFQCDETLFEIVQWGFADSVRLDCSRY